MLRCRLSSSKIAQTSEKYQARLNIFPSECSLCYLKIAQTSEKYEVYFNIFPGECSFILAVGKDSAKLRLNERRIKLA